MSSQIEEVKGRVDVVDLIGSYLKLNKAGVNFKTRCPFHNEKSASFFVSSARQIWHCFGCQKGGDAFKFIMEIEGCEFKEALEILAQRAGVELKRESPQIKDERQKQFEILEEATKFFENRLAGEALLYLKQRGLLEETIREFRLGYAPDDWRSLLNHLSSKGFKEADIEKAGLIIKKENFESRTSENYYDRFRGRLIFPIFNQSGKVIAFGGRIYPEKNGAAKYVNSPETLLYQKSKTLYGLHKSKIEILRRESCVIVEGYTDFLMTYQAGTKNVVASSGTALTQEQLRILRRICEKIIAAFDMDEAGETASSRGIELALREGFDVRVLKFGDGLKDPADVVLRGKDLWLSCLQNSRHVVQFYIDSASRKFAAGSPELSREIQKNVLPAVSNLFSELEQAHWVGEISRILNIKEEAIWSALQKIQNSKSEILNNTEILNAQKPQTRKELLENRMMGIAAKYPEIFSAQGGSLPADATHQALQAGASGGESSYLEYITAQDFIKEKQDKFAASHFVLETELFLENISDAKTELIKCARELQREHLKDKMNQISVKINYAEKNKKDDLPQLLVEFKNLSERVNKI